MKHETARRWRRIAALGSVGATFALACAGSDIPPDTSELREDLVTAYGGSAAGTGGRGGSAGAAGAAGSANAGQSGSGNEGGAAGSGAGGAAGAAGSGDTGGAAGSGGAGGGAAGSGGSGGGDVCNGFAVLQANCGDSNCHGDPGPFGNFAATLADAEAVIGEEGGTICNGYGPLIDPSNPEDSIIVQKVTGEAECGGIMPAGGADPLEQADIDCIVEWIGSLEE